jgi:molybdenum cofactor cytidylyltransferase
MHRLADGTPIGIAAACNLALGMDNVMAVVRPDDHELKARMRAERIPTVTCERARFGISASLAAGIRVAPDAQAWLIALADMAWIRPRTIRSLVYELRAGAEITAPVYEARRGHPVGFTQCFKSELLKLSGDRGARDVLMKFPAQLKTLQCDDPAVLQDIDTPGDLAAHAAGHSNSRVNRLPGAFDTSA